MQIPGFDQLLLDLLKNRSDSKATQLFNSLPIAITLFNKKGVLVAINDYAIQMLEIRDRQAVLGTNILRDDIFGPSVKERLANEDMFSEWHYFDFGALQHAGITARKDKMRLFTRVKKMVDEKGQLQGYVMLDMEDKPTATDTHNPVVPAIAENRGTMELEILADEEKNPVAIYAHKVQESAAEMLGKTQGQMEGEDLLRIGVFLPFAKELLGFTRLKQKKTYYYFAMASRRYLRWTLIYQGRKRFSSLIVDITDYMMGNDGLMFSETLFRTMYDSSPVSVLLLDKMRRIEDCNEPYLRMWGYKDKNDVIGHLFPRDPRLDSPEYWESGLDTFEIEQEYVFDKKKYYKDSPTTRLYLSIKAQKYYMANGEMRGWIIFLRDITRTKTYEHDLEEQKEDAQKKSDRKSRFIQNMSHDIRTPLNAIVGFSQLLALPDGTLTEEEKEEYSSHIFNNSNMLMMLVDDILNISDVESGNYHITKRPVAVNDLCVNTLKSVEYRVPIGVNMYYTSDVENDAVINTDGRRVQQVLINFLTNACKHTAEGEIHLECRVKEIPRQIRFSVIDTGEGVDPAMADDIFERFTKLNTVEGTGLGLNICRTISKALGGEVKLDKSYTGGAKFDFILPLE